tara:strand:+ start:429 stop:674 length:246 start_codon:yes stop_codon:yes gene_type:complete
MSDSWIYENEERMDSADRWEREADREGIHEDWQTHPIYDGERPQVKDINVWVSVDVDTTMSYEKVVEKIKAKLELLDWEVQ